MLKKIRKAYDIIAKKLKNMVFQNHHWIIKNSCKQGHHSQDDLQYSEWIGTLKGKEDKKLTVHVINHPLTNLIFAIPVKLSGTNPINSSWQLCHFDSRWYFSLSDGLIAIFFSLNTERVSHVMTIITCSFNNILFSRLVVKYAILQIMVDIDIYKMTLPRISLNN